MTTLPTNSITTLLSHCKIALISQKLSLTSRKLYLADIKRFLSWLPKSKLTPSKLSDPKIYHNYLEYLKKQEISPSMMRRTTASLRQLGKIINSMYNLGNPTSSLSPTRRHTDTPTHRHADTPAHWKYIKHFTNYLTLQHLSPSTIKSYKSDISRYITWVHDQGVSRTGKELLTQKNINKYLKYLANSTDYPASTRTRKQASINRFQAWYLDSYGSDLTPDKKLKGLSLGFKGRSLTGDLAKGQVGTAKLEGASLKGFHFKSYLSLGLITLLILSLGYFGFQAFSRDQVLLSQAYPSTPVGPNRQLSFQGRLEDSGGTPITSSTNLVFKLFDASTVGSELYSTGTCAITPDTDGVFSTQIGSSCGSGIGSDVFSENADVWLEVTVGAETLTPRQQIATVAYALNSETLQGIPLSSTMSAIANSIVPMNSYGEIIIGEQSPRMTAVSGTFAISAPALSLTTTTGSSGNISIAPDGTGQVNVTGNTTSTNFFNVTNAQLTTGSLLTGTVANSNTGYLLLDLLSGSSPTSKFSVADDGDTTLAGDLTITGDDLFMTTNTAGMLLVADGTNYNPTAISGDITINGSGATVIGADKILESHLKAVDTASDEECLTYEVTTGDFEWQSCGGGGAAGSWQESLGAISPNNSTWDLLIGGTATSSAKIAFTNINSGTPTIRSADATALNITGNAASTWNTTAGDLTLSADAASVNINANEAAANQIDLTASGTVAGDAININTADGGIILNAAGASNGDVTLTSADDTVVTATGLLSLTGGAGSLIDFSTFDINSSGIISMIDSVAHTIEDVGGNLTLTSAASAAVSIVNDLYVSSGISTFGTAVSDGTVEATKFCTGDGETNCVTDFSTLGGGLFTDGGTYVYPTSGETLGNSASAGANKIAGLYLADSAPLTFGNDNDIDFTFAGSELATTLGSNTWNINSNLLFLNGSTSRIGIGTGSPLATLDIRSTLGTIPTASISGNTSMASLIVDQSGTGDIFAASSSGETRFVVASDGNVGIGVQDPSSKLEIGGSTSTISNDSGDITINAASNFISLAGDSLGNLLDLSVAGDASVSGVLSFDGLSPSSINALNGNEFTFRTSVGGDTGLTTAMTIHNSGNIGLLADSYINWGATEGTSGYGFRDNSGTIQYKNSGGAWGNIGGGGAAGMWQENTGAISQLNNTWDVLIGSTATSSALVKFPGITGGDVIFNAGGNVGIGTTAPGEELEVVGDVGAQRFVDTASATYYLDPAATGTSLIVDGNMISNGAFSITSNGTNGNITIDAGTGTVVIGSSGTGKLDAGTIDPPYTINGDKFATYLSGMTGVKEETTGSVQTTEHIPGYGYRAAIDLASAPQGSDLWLFREVTNLHEQFDELVVLLSANSNTRTWYELVPESGLIQIYSSAPSTISYRLTAPRFDAETWANTRDGSDALGFILEGQTDWDTSSQPPEAPTTNPFAEIFHSITTTIAQITSLETNLISPLDSTQPLTIAANTIITPGDPSLPTLTIDGEIQASSISARIARLEELDVDTLRANNIIANSITANSIEGLDAKIASLSAGSTTELSDDDLETITDRIKARLADLTDTTAQDISTPPEATFSASSIPLSENEENYSTGTDSATLASLDADMVFINDYLAVIGQAVITNLDITGYFYTDSITSKSNTLALQPTGGLVNLANNTLIVDSSGQVAINGDLTVSGKILAQSAQLGSLELGTPPATPSSQLGQLLAVYNESGEAVATIDASGSASFRDLSTRLITIAAPSDATESASTSALAQALGISSTSNATAGEATLVSPNTELIIESEYVSDNTLVYLTPTTNTDNKVVFVKAKETCPPPPPDVSVVLTPCTRSFTVAVDSPAATDISFNWWIIKLESQQ